MDSEVDILYSILLSFFQVFNLLLCKVILNNWREFTLKLYFSEEMLNLRKNFKPIIVNKLIFLSFILATPNTPLSYVEGACVKN